MTTEHEEWKRHVRAVDRAADKLRQAQVERDRAVTAAIRFGIGQREVARIAGLSHPGVAKIAARTA